MGSWLEGTPDGGDGGADRARLVAELDGYVAATADRGAEVRRLGEAIAVMHDDATRKRAALG